MLVFFKFLVNQSIVLPSRIIRPLNDAAWSEKVISQTVRNDRGTIRAPIIAQPYMEATFQFSFHESVPQQTRWKSYHAHAKVSIILVLVARFNEWETGVVAVQVTEQTDQHLLKPINCNSVFNRSDRRIRLKYRCHCEFFFKRLNWF